MGCRDAKAMLALVSLFGLVLMVWPSLPGTLSSGNEQQEGIVPNFV